MESSRKMPGSPFLNSIGRSRGGFLNPRLHQLETVCQVRKVPLLNGGVIKESDEFLTLGQSPLAFVGSCSCREEK